MINNQQGKKTKGILGIGIILTGFLVLAIGLIIGIGFPKHVLSKVKDNLCVINPFRRSYDRWIRNEERVQYNRIYFMDLINKDGFLHRKETPEFRKRGPYVFRESEFKTDVKFSESKVIYRSRKVQQFDSDITIAECGQNCSENDTVTVINNVFLQIIGPYMDDVNFSYALIPKLLQGLRRHSLKKRPFTSVSQRGTDSFKENDPSENVDDFDLWLYKNDTNFKIAVLNDPNTRLEAPSELIRFYDLFSDPVKFGVRQLLNRSLQMECDAIYNRSLFACTRVGYQYLSSNNQCGVMFYLKKLLFTPNHSKETDHLLSSVNLLIPKKLRPWYLIELHEKNTTLYRAYLEALHVYIFEYLCIFLMKTLKFERTALVISLPVRHLALGYVSSLKEVVEKNANFSLVLKSFIEQQFFVQGILSHSSPEKGAEDLETEKIILRTCLWEKSSRSNLFFHAIQTPSAWPDDVSQPKPFHFPRGGFTSKVPPSFHLVACVSPWLLQSTFPVYISDLKTSVDFVFSFRKSTKGVALEIYTPCEVKDKNECNISVTKGLFHVHLLSLPNSTRVNLPEGTKIAVEPITGEIWEQSSLVRVDVAIPPFLSWTGINVESHDRRLPFYWLHRIRKVSPEVEQRFEAEVALLMRISCVGVISLMILGALIVIIGCGIVFLKKPQLKIGPESTLNTEDMNSF